MSLFEMCLCSTIFESISNKFRFEVKIKGVEGIVFSMGFVLFDDEFSQY